LEVNKFHITSASELETITTGHVYPKVTRFERAWIELSLQNKKEDPFTREPLQVEFLVSDTDLKIKIDKFVDDVVEKAAPAAAKK